jgi:hypothetical protein
MNREIVRMNLTGLEPELRKEIRDLCESTIRAFDGAPEHVATFNEARDLLALVNEVDEAEAEHEQPEIVLMLGGRNPGLFVDGQKM